MALGTYFLDGIRAPTSRADPARAREIFNYAASYYGDPNAQYNLARLYSRHGRRDGARHGRALVQPRGRKGHPRRRRCSAICSSTGDGIGRQQRAMA